MAQEDSIQTNASTLMEDTQASLAKLLQETSEKTKLEIERINLERERAQRQQEILNKEEHHNAQLDRMVILVDELSKLIQQIINPSIQQLHAKVGDIYHIQETLIIFLIKEYEKLNDEKYQATIESLREVLANISSKITGNNNFHVVGSLKSEKDVNITG